jgi:hypothetical protein
MAVEWDDIQSAASRMFNIWTSGGDLIFAKECWSHLAEAGMIEDDGVVVLTNTYLRLVALRLVYGEFCAAKWDENAETEIVYLAEDLAIDKLALGLLASPHIEHGDILIEDDYELYEAALTAAVEAIRSETFECIRSAYGGQTGLYQRMARTAGNEDWDDESDLEPTANNLEAFQFAERGQR